jgi:hypothetical protein
MVLAEAIALLFLAYLGIGFAVAIPFATVGVNRADPDAAGGTWGFRLIILPGVMALWPLMLARWVKGPGSLPAERNAHRLAARRERKR